MAASSNDNGSSNGEDGSFTALVERAARAAAQLASAPPAPASTQSGQPQQDPATRVLAELQRVAALADSLSLISPNEALRDISTPSLRALLLPSFIADVLTRQRTPPAAPGSTENPFEGRKKVLQAAVVQARNFLAAVTRLNILPSSTTALLGARNELLNASASAASSSSSAEATFLPSSSVSASAAQSRQLKISLFKLERSLTASLDAYREQARAMAARRHTGIRAPAQGLSSSSASSPATAAPEEAFYDLLVLVADPQARSGRDGDNGDSEDDEDDDESKAQGAAVASSSSTASVPTPTSLRSYLLLLLNLHALKAYALLESATQELALLASMPPPSQAFAGRDGRSRDNRDSTAGPSDSTWKLDTPLGGGLTSGPLLDPKGRPLRPFTITGSSSTNAAAAQPQDPSSKREAMRAQVFQPSHRLPTMSIDDYLAEEERRGNILRGGGHEGAAKPTPKEERAIRAELDGTREGEEAEEEERQEKIKWDNWADEHRRGEGNTMNRG